MAKEIFGSSFKWLYFETKIWLFLQIWLFFTNLALLQIWLKRFDLNLINIISHCVYFSRECNDPRKYHLLHNSYIILTLITHSKHVFFRLGKGVVGQKFTTVYTQPSYWSYMFWVMYLYWFYVHFMCIFIYICMWSVWV